MRREVTAPIVVSVFALTYVGMAAAYLDYESIGLGSR
jgi:hypothetical protein